MALVGSFPYISIAALGTRSCRLLSTGIVAATLNVVEVTSFLVVAVLNDAGNVTQWSTFLSVDSVNVATLAAFALALNVRVREKAALHTAKLITNPIGSPPLLVK